MWLNMIYGFEISSEPRVVCVCVHVYVNNFAKGHWTNVQEDKKNMTRANFWGQVSGKRTRKEALDWLQQTFSPSSKELRTRRVKSKSKHWETQPLSQIPGTCPLLSHQAQADPANGIKSKANYWKNCAWGKKMVKWMSDHYQWAPKRNNSQYSRHPAMRSQVGLCSSLWTKLMEVIEFQLSYFKS